tara:strand:- start:300 stop:854 length:555 start_codon:yes stop_codon:yes gene_type:complete
MMKIKKIATGLAVGISLSLLSSSAVFAAPNKGFNKANPKRNEFKKNGCMVTVKAGLSSNPMAYDKKTIEIDVEKCKKKFLIVLENTNMEAFSKAAMGHNLVISSGKDKSAVLKDAMTAGKSKWYLGDKGYLYATAMLAPKEFHDLEIDVTKIQKYGDLKFFCTFLGHSAMVGDIVLKKNTKKKS